MLAFAPNLNPVSWSAEAAEKSAASGALIVIRVKAKIAEGYHLYSLTTPKGGPIPTKLRFSPESGVESFTVQQRKPEVRMDATFGLPVESFAGETEFTVQAKLAKNLPPGERSLTVIARYQACSDVICLPPVERRSTAAIRVR